MTPLTFQRPFCQSRALYISINDPGTPQHSLRVADAGKPPRFGAQARIHGLMTELARRHDLTAVMLVDEEFDIEECRLAMQAFCRKVVLIRNPYGGQGLPKRLLLASIRSFERLRVTVPAMQQALDKVLRSKRFDIVNLESTFLGHCDLRQAPPGDKLPHVIVDSHNIDYDLAR